TDEDGRRKPIDLTVDRIRHELARAARWTKARVSPFGSTMGRDDALPPMDVCRNILASPELPFPILKAITEVPVVTGDGRNISRPGYDPASGILYHPFDPDMVIEIPDHPTQEDIAAAKTTFDEMIGDFAFVGDSDRAHAVGLACGMFCRELIDGP